MIGWLVEALTYGAIGALVGATWATHHNAERTAQCVTHHERQLSPHEQQDNGPTPALAPGRWIDERYQL